MKKIITIALILFTGNICFSQNSYTTPNVNGLSFPLFLDKAVRSSFDSKLSDLGIDGSCWIKFKISPSGNIKELEISPGTDSSLTAVLKEAVLHSDGLWTFRNEKEWLILPFRYTLQKEGKTETVALNSNELNSFFSEEANSQITWTFLPVQEFVSPFDRGTGTKLKIKKESN